MRYLSAGFVVFVCLSLPLSGDARSQSGQANQDLKKIEKQIGAEKSTADEARARAEIMARDIASL